MKFSIVFTLFILFIFGFNTAYSNNCTFDTTIQADKGEKKITYRGFHPKIKNAIEKAELVLKDEQNKFYQSICAHEDFTFTIESPKEIAEWLYKTALELNIKGYQGGTDTLTLAYVSDKYPNTIFINTSKLNDEDRRVSDVANTLIHEMIHNLDLKIEYARFGHGNNSAAGKSQSAPYRIGRIAQRVIEGEVNFDKFIKNNKEVIIKEKAIIDESKVERWHRKYPES
jgi:hypothetical protein